MPLMSSNNKIGNDDGTKRVLNSIKMIISKQKVDGAWYENGKPSISLSSICSLSLISVLHGGYNKSDVDNKEIKDSIQKSLDFLCISESNNSSDKLLKCLALMASSDFIKDKKIANEIQNSLKNLDKPNNIFSELSQCMFVFQGANKENNAPKWLPNTQDAIRRFKQLDTLLGSNNKKYYFRLHLKFVLLWASSRGRPFDNCLNEIWYSDSFKKTRTNDSNFLRDESLFVMTYSSFRFTKWSSNKHVGTYNHLVEFFQPKNNNSIKNQIIRDNNLGLELK